VTPVLLRPRAKADVAEASRWYADQRPGLDREFRDDLRAVFRSLAERPFLHPVIYRDTRRALLHRFPYGVFYLAEPERVLVLRVLHHARDPRVWPGRG
jgi:plasmid stabilization system protein ParE